MKKPKTMAGLLTITNVTRGRRGRRSRTIGKSIQQIMGITEIMGIVSNSLRIRRRKGHSDNLPMQKSGVRSIIPQNTIWRSARLF
jgi:hypothetical protein